MGYIDQYYQQEGVQRYQVTVGGHGIAIWDGVQGEQEVG